MVENPYIGLYALLDGDPTNLDESNIMEISSGGGNNPLMAVINSSRTESYIAVCAIKCKDVSVKDGVRIGPFITVPNTKTSITFECNDANATDEEKKSKLKLYRLAKGPSTGGSSKPAHNDPIWDSNLIDGYNSKIEFDHNKIGSSYIDDLIDSLHYRIFYVRFAPRTRVDPVVDKTVSFIINACIMPNT